MKATLELDGRSVGMKGYVQEVLGNVVLGVVRTMKGVPDDWDEAVVRIERD
ncbi:MAG: hypothetical protein MAG715_00521 [Methanonatronarchaeales archaeon]|nr:hypothetical protein [Methanonatronarchaeales archaeon]